jgi:sulfate adenylyltransferase subunit 2
MGGARRDEEKAHAKERFFSHSDDFGQWDPKNQRPELWKLFNRKKRMGEHFRVFPISNWTEMNVWQYILKENIAIPEVYFAKERNVIWRNGSWLPVSEFITLKDTDTPQMKMVRFRTFGDITITGGQESDADTLEKIIQEVASSRPIKMNDIARVKIRSTKPLFADDYKINRVTGSIILVDEATNETVAA